MTTTSANKMTYVKALEWVLENPRDDVPSDVTTKLEQLLEAQKNRAGAGNKKAAERSAENTALADWLFDYMAQDSSAQYTPTDLLGIVQNKCELKFENSVTVQKVTYALRLLVDGDQATRTKKGKKTLYSAIVE